MTSYQRQVLAAVAAIGLLDYSDSHFRPKHTVTLKNMRDSFDIDSDEELVTALNWLTTQGLLNSWVPVRHGYGGYSELGSRQWTITKLGLVELWAP